VSYIRFEFEVRDGNEISAYPYASLISRADLKELSSETLHIRAHKSRCNNVAKFIVQVSECSLDKSPAECAQTPYLLYQVLLFPCEMSIDLLLTIEAPDLCVVWCCDDLYHAG
jgi:hypothetical protein